MHIVIFFHPWVCVNLNETFHRGLTGHKSNPNLKNLISQSDMK